jgi:hypothetical protein
VASDVLEVLCKVRVRGKAGLVFRCDKLGRRKLKSMKPLAATSGGLLANVGNSRQPKQRKVKVAEIMADRPLRLSVH